MKEEREVKKLFKQKKLREIEEELDHSVKEDLEEFDNKNPIRFAAIDREHNFIYYRDGTIDEI